MKIIFVDFDDTIGLHEQSIDDKNTIDWSDPRVLFGTSNYIFRKTILNTQLIEALKQIKDKNKVKIIILSMSGTYAVDKKKKWLKEKGVDYLFDDFIGLSIDLDKGEYIKAYQLFYKIKPTDCILIDDSRKHIMKAKKYCYTFLPHMFTLELNKIIKEIIKK